MELEREPEVHAPLVSQQILNELRKLRTKDEAKAILALSDFRASLERKYADDPEYQGENKRRLRWRATSHLPVKAPFPRLFYEVTDPVVIAELREAVVSVREQLPPHDLLDIMSHTHWCGGPNPTLINPK